MSNEIIVVYYSNYFPKTVEMKEYLENSENVRTLNVDNVDISRRILTDDTYKIKYVPSILSLKEDGTIQIYEKDAAFLYYENIKRANEEGDKETQIQSTIPPDEKVTEELPVKNANMSIMDIAKAMENGREG